MALLLFCLALPSYAQPARDHREEELLQKKWQECIECFDLRMTPPRGRLRMLTGAAPNKGNPNSGYYFKVGQAIGSAMRQMEQPSERLDLVETPTCRTSCNLVGLQLGKADLALVQSDAAHDAWFGHPPVALSPAPSLKLVGQLYVEVTHVLVRPHLNVANLKDLRGRRVWLGPKDSFTVFTARRILEAAGLNREDVDALEEHCPRASYSGQSTENCKKIRELTAHEAMDGLENLELDALFQVGPMPLDPVRDVLVPGKGSDPNLDQCKAVEKARREDPHFRDREIRLFNLDVDLVNRLVADGSYIEQLIGADVYCQEHASLTVGVRALLLTNQPADHPAIKTLTNTLFRRPELIEAELKRQVVEEQIRHGDPVNGLPSRLGLLRVNLPDSLVVRQVPHDWHPFPWVRMQVILLLGGFVFVIGVLHFFRRRVGPLLARRGELVIGFLGLFFAWVAAAVLLWNCERHVNPSYATFGDAMLATLLGLFPGGDQPITAVGQHYWTVCRWIAGFVFGGIVISQVHQWVTQAIRMAQAWLLGLGRDRPERQGK